MRIIVPGVFVGNGGQLLHDQQLPAVATAENTGQ
jgi:hypothetical protein